MDTDKDILSLGKVKPKKQKTKMHTPSKMQADTLFTFTTHGCIRHLVY